MITTQNEPDDRLLNALSFDIEDWFHMVDIEAVADPNTWSGFETIVEHRTDQILEICDQAGVRATFFILGWIAEHYPALVKRIADAGHEIGTHSYWHQPVYSLDEDEFRKDIKRSIDCIHDAASCEVTSFRAPSFSITPGCEWAIDVLHEFDLQYDASLFPTPRGNGGYPCPREPHVFNDAPSGKGMPELPMSVMRIAGRKLAFSGGGYMRLLPNWLIRRGFNQLNAEGMPVVVYLHPRDFAPDSPRVPMSKSRHFKAYVGLASTAGKLDALLRDFRFGTCKEVLERNLQPREGDAICST